MKHKKETKKLLLEDSTLKDIIERFKDSPQLYHSSHSLSKDIGYYMLDFSRNDEEEGKNIKIKTILEISNYLESKLNNDYFIIKK